MTIAELIAELQKLPQDSLVVMSKDGEGNGYSPLADVAESLYQADSTYSGEQYLSHAELDRLLADAGEHGWSRGYTEEDRAPEDCVPAVTFWPTN